MKGSILYGCLLLIAIFCILAVQVHSDNGANDPAVFGNIWEITRQIPPSLVRLHLPWARLLLLQECFQRRGWMGVGSRREVKASGKGNGRKRKKTVITFVDHSWSKESVTHACLSAWCQALCSSCDRHDVSYFTHSTVSCHWQPVVRLPCFGFSAWYCHAWCWKAVNWSRRMLA